jgi:hypothetical protein
LSLETNKTPNKIWWGKKPIVKYFKTFGSKCYILRDRENLGKFDPKSDEGIFLGYSTNSHAYRVFNKRTETVMEPINVIIDDEEIEASSKREEIQPIPTELPIPLADKIKPSTSPQETPGITPAVESLPVPATSDTTASASEDEDVPTYPYKQSWVKLNHPLQQLIGTFEEWYRLRNRVIQPSSEVANQVSYNCYLAQTEPKKLMKPYKMKAGSLPCMMSYISLLEMMYGLLFPDILIIISLEPSGFSRTNQMSMVQWSKIRHDLLLRVTLRLKG